ncbi:RDD family protein [Citricoccus sp. NR2]|uniref:RDD family protein n=1 Tax=Citricoccus sp. NR2 TaxID=3004095 RepID=UPI0022DE153B|nr:RDD family protein [Citricoccus sp. NR2]WBL18979.1 RDD family protein [Citricoccus sp. NR2]
MSSATVITGEAVVLQLRPATIIQRAAATLIDGVALALLTVGLIWTLAQFDVTLDQAAGQAAVIVTMVFLLVLVPFSVETLTRGRSLGKWALGLRAVRDDGGGVRARHVLARVLTGVFEVWMTAGSVAVIASMMNERGKRLGDMVAGTYLITQRLPKLPPPLPDVPAPLRQWASTADVGRLPDSLAVAITRFLRQAERMLPEARQRTAWNLTQQVAPYVAPGPGAQVPPEAFLHAVVAERRNRDYAILQARREAMQERASRLVRSRSF